MFHKRCCVNIFIFGKVLKGGLMKKLINLASWAGYKQGEVNNACRQAWNHEVIETFSSFIHYSQRHNKGPVRGKMWWDSTVPNPTGFLHVVLSQVLYSLFATFIQAAPGSYCSSSPILPTMFHLPHGPQPDTASLVDQSVPSLFSSLFFPPSLPYASSFQLAFHQSLLVTMLGDGGGEVCKTAEGYKILPLLQAPGIVPGLVLAAWPLKPRSIRRTRTQDANWRQNTLTQSKTWSVI